MRFLGRKNRKTYRFDKTRLYVNGLLIARALTVGLSYYSVAGIPGLTSSFVAIFVALLPFDIIVALPRFSLKQETLKELILVLLPRIRGTAITLASGVFLGLFFGTLSSRGLPPFLGAIFTVGLAYLIGSETKGNISSFVGLVAGLTLFEQILRLGLPDANPLIEVVRLSFRMFYGTFLGLFSGYLVGVIMGGVTRSFLPRGFRSSKSVAYAQPLFLQSFKEVTHLDEGLVLTRIKVPENSPLAYKSLAETALRSMHDVSVLSIYRKPKDIVAPKGADQILPEDLLVVLLKAEDVTEFGDYVKGSEGSEPV